MSNPLRHVSARMYIVRTEGAYFEKIRVFQASVMPGILAAWNNIIGLWTYLLVSRLK